MTRFEQFVREKRYVCNVSPATVEWYEQSLNWLGTESPTAEDIKNVIIKMRSSGLKVTSVNCRLRAIKSYIRWAGFEIDIPRLKEPTKVLPTFSAEDISKLHHWKPKTMTQQRLQSLILTLADTGCRIDEVLSLSWAEIDFDNLLVTVTGKGSKQRKIPFSFELRKVLWKWRGRNEHRLVFPSRTGCKLGRRDILRDTKNLCRSLKIEIPERTLHAFRHTFAINYLRRGGSVFHLQKVLGHSSLEMTRKYCNVLTDDLQAVHQQVSLLSGSGRGAENFNVGPERKSTRPSG